MTFAVTLNGPVYFALVVGALVGTIVVAGRKFADPAVRGKKMQAGLCYAFLLLLFVGIFLAPTNAEGDPSLLITVGAGFALFSAALQWGVPSEGRAHQRADVALLMVAVFGLRLSATLRFQGYLPTDPTGDGCYQLIEALTAACFLSGVGSAAARDVVRVLLILCICAGVATQCYGDLDSNKLADRTYATAMYGELVATLLLVKVVVGGLAGPKARAEFSGAFLAPAVAQSACRAYFWALAFPEVAPQKPELLMDAFPSMIVGVHAVQTLLFASAGLALLWPQRFLEQVALPTLVAPPGAGCAGFKPGRAVFEQGVLTVEYVAV